MKYGESIFDIAYLLTAFALGILMLIKAKNKAHRQMGKATLFLAVGDAFHLVPRILNYFIDGDYMQALGMGKLITSLTMTFFYIYMFYICYSILHKKSGIALRITVYALTVARFVLCGFHQNGWLSNDTGNLLWSILRNIPFVLLGALVIILYFMHRKELGRMKIAWLYVTLSFLFYIPVALFAGKLPLLGALMLPKTVCYILLVVTFFICVKNNDFSSEEDAEGRE